MPNVSVMFKSITKQQGSQTDPLNCVIGVMFKSITKQQGSQTSNKAKSRALARGYLVLCFYFSTFLLYFQLFRINLRL